MSFTTADLQAIDAAIASGELTVSHNGRTVTYRSMDDLMKARATIVAELAGAQSGRTGGPHRFTFSTAREC
ncbi:MAG: hypothetical protein IBJ14_04990 [Hydrogenophaga sp.]|nr:hypothetical protein [Hydrogenophaga sp.]